MNAALRKAATNAANYIRRNGFGHDQEERIAEIEAALAEPGNPLEEAIRQTKRDIASAGMLPAAAQLAAILPLQSHLRDLLEQRAQLLAHPVYVVEGSVGKLLEALANRWEDEAAGSWGETKEHATLQRCADELRALLAAALSA